MANLGFSLGGEKTRRDITAAPAQAGAVPAQAPSPRVSESSDEGASLSSTVGGVVPFPPLTNAARIFMLSQ